MQETLVGAEIQTRAVAGLRAGGDPFAADVLASCTLQVVIDAVGDVGLELVGPIVTHAGVLDLSAPLAATLAGALRAALPPGVWVERLWARPAETSRDALHDALRMECDPIPPLSASILTTSDAGGGGLNQAVGELAPRTWAGMRFRSESEAHIARALDRAGALFLPGALMRLGVVGARHTREADFLVCWQGVWGILEVDGAPFHGPDRASADAARDRVFNEQGIGVIMRADAARCFAAPDAVVAAFLALLQRPGGASEQDERSSFH